MPCYEVRTLSVEFQAKHRDLLLEALKALGWPVVADGNLIQTQYGIVIDLDKQKAELPTAAQGNLNEIKRAYSQAALDRVAKKNLWRRKETSANAGVLSRF